MVRKVIFSLAVMAAGLGAATPAFASKIIYTVTGNFSGNFYPSPSSGASVPFSAPATFTGISDTSTGYSTFAGLTFSFLDSASVTSVLGTTATEVFALAGTPASGEFALVGFETRVLGFSSDALKGYDSRTAIALTPVTWSGDAGEVRYAGGFVDYTSASDLTFSATLAGAVPEPATWTMMILGFGLVGAAMRRRAVTSVARA